MTDGRMTGDAPAALVTGSATGVGRAEAVALAAAGYDVAINYSRSRDAAEETAAACQAHGAKTIVIGCDVADDVQVKAMVAETGTAFGRLDVLCNNAGITSSAPFKDLDAIDLDEWDRVLAVNVRGIVQVTRACVPLLRTAKGTIVNTAAVRAEAARLFDQQGGGCLADQDAGAGAGSGNPGQCCGAGLDGRRLDGAYAGRTLRQVDGTARPRDAAQTLRDRRRRRRHDAEPGTGKPVRHR